MPFLRYILALLVSLCLITDSLAASSFGFQPTPIVDAVSADFLISAIPGELAMTEERQIVSLGDAGSTTGYRHQILKLTRAVLSRRLGPWLTGVTSALAILMPGLASGAQTAPSTFIPSAVTQIAGSQPQLLYLVGKWSGQHPTDNTATGIGFDFLRKIGLDPEKFVPKVGQILDFSGLSATDQVKFLASHTNAMILPAPPPLPALPAFTAGQTPLPFEMSWWDVVTNMVPAHSWVADLAMGAVVVGVLIAAVWLGRKAYRSVRARIQAKPALLKASPPQAPRPESEPWYRNGEIGGLTIISITPPEDIDPLAVFSAEPASKTSKNGFAVPPAALQKKPADALAGWQRWMPILAIGATLGVLLGPRIWSELAQGVPWPSINHLFSQLWMFLPVGILATGFQSDIKGRRSIRSAA